MAAQTSTSAELPFAQDRQFRRLWFGETVSYLGTGVSLIAVPFLALDHLTVSVLQLGVLNALIWLPFAMLALPLGALADTTRLRPLLLLAQTGRALLLGLVPLLTWLDLLTFPVLLVIMTLVGILNVLFDVSFFAFIPLAVRRDSLVRANSWLHGSQSVALVAGPALGGALVATLGPAPALGVDGLTFFVSLLALASVRVAEEPAGSFSWARLRGRVASGARVALGTREIRAVLGQSTCYNCFYFIIITLMYPYLLDELHATEAQVARLLAISGLAAVVGSLLAARIAQRVGHGRAILLTACNAPLAAAAWPLSAYVGEHQYLMVTIGWALSFFGVSINNVLTTSLRQSLSPPDLMASSNAVYRLAVWGVSPLGALFAGAMGSSLGFAQSFLVAWFVALAVPTWIIASPLPSLRRLPAAIGAEKAAT